MGQQGVGGTSGFRTHTHENVDQGGGLGNNIVGSNQIAALAVTLAKMAAGAVDETKLAASTYGTPGTFAHGQSVAAGVATKVLRADALPGMPAGGAWEPVETKDVSSGTSVTFSSLPTDSDLFKIVMENVKATGTPGFRLTTPNASHRNWKDNTTDTQTASNQFAEFGESSAAPVNGWILIPRVASGGFRVMPAKIGWELTATPGRKAETYRIDSTSVATITSIVMSVNVGAFNGGKIHLYKLVGL